MIKKCFDDCVEEVMDLLIENSMPVEEPLDVRAIEKKLKLVNSASRENIERVVRKIQLEQVRDYARKNKALGIFIDYGGKKEPAFNGMRRHIQKCEICGNAYFNYVFRGFSSYLDLAEEAEEKGYRTIPLMPVKAGIEADVYTWLNNNITCIIFN